MSDRAPREQTSAPAVFTPVLPRSVPTQPLDTANAPYLDYSTPLQAKMRPFEARPVHSPFAQSSHPLASRPFILPNPTQATRPSLQAQLKHAEKFGNSLVPNLATPIQTKLTVGAPGDRYEQEADRVAEQVMSMPDSATQQPVQRAAAPEEDELQTKAIANSITPLVQREALPEEDEPMQMKAIAPIQREALPEEEEAMQMKAIAPIQREVLPEEKELQTKPTLQRATDGSLPAGHSIESRLNSSKGGGSPLPDTVRSFMEPRFGIKLDHVRVHTDNEAVQMNRDLNAQAFTHQQDVYFGAGKAPEKDTLTAHELAHVVQQTGAVQTKEALNQPNVQLKCAACEEEANVQRSVKVSSVLGSDVQRSWFGDDDEEKKEPEDNSGGSILDWAKEKTSGAVDSVTQAGSDAYDWAKEKGGAAVDSVSQAGGDAYDWAKEKGSEAVDIVTQAGSDAYDWTKEKASGAVDTVTQAGSDAYHWAKEKGEAVVDTVTQSGGDAYDWAKEKGEQYGNEFLEGEKARLLAQISQAIQKVTAQDFVYLSSDQIAALNGHLAALSQETQGAISLQGIAGQTTSTEDPADPPGTTPIAASTVATLLQNLQIFLSAPSSETDQGRIQRSAIAAPNPIFLIIAFIVFLILMVIAQTKPKARTCPSCPPNPFPEIDRVPPSTPHFPCPGDHWHFKFYNQNPITCQCFLSARLFGGCCGQPALDPRAPAVPC